MRSRPLAIALAALVAAATATVAVPVATAAHTTGFPDWPTYHGNRMRSGYSTSMPAASGVLQLTARRTLDGAVYASPIVVAGRTFVVTENDTVYGFGPRNRALWSTHLGAPSPQAERPCGNIDPLGITSTPVYSYVTGELYVSAELSGSPPSHRLYALDPATGRVAFSRSLDLPGVDAVAMQQRGALTITGGRVWVPFGGLGGDCAQYKGRVIGYRLDGSGQPVAFTVPTARMGGIWASPGPTVGPGGRLFVAVGNGAATSDPYDFSDSVIALDGTAHRVDFFAPSSWASENAADLDLGSQGPALVGPWIFQAGKSGTGYVLRASDLGGIGAQVSERRLCDSSFGGTAVRGNVVYVPCSDGVRAVAIDSQGGMRVLWSASVYGSPVVGGGRVWVVDTASGTLYALGLAHGIVRGAIGIGSVAHFVTPAISGPRLIIGTGSGYVVVRTS